MNEKSLICRIDRRMKALLLAIVMIVTTITVPVHADENANPEENVVVNFVKEETTGEGTVLRIQKERIIFLIVHLSIMMLEIKMLSIMLLMKTVL